MMISQGNSTHKLHVTISRSRQKQSCIINLKTCKYHKYLKDNICKAKLSRFNTRQACTKPQLMTCSDRFPCKYIASS